MGATFPSASSATGVAPVVPAENICVVKSLGCISYQDGLAIQQELVARRKAHEIPNTLLLLEHTPVITLGRNSNRAHVVTPDSELRDQGIEIAETNRGGDVTYHGPGQLVGYPIFDLASIRKDVVWYVRTLEEAIIRTVRDFGVEAERIPGLTGVWVNGSKVASIGVHISRWVTSHGFALNVETDLKHFQHIVPCGIANCQMTSLRKLTGIAIDRSAVEDRLIHHLGNLFGLTMQPAESESMERSEQCQLMC